MAKYSSQFPDPVALITVATAKKTNVMTVGWTSPISFDPPILLVSIAPKRFTHDLIVQSGEFGVSILADDQKDLATLAGTFSGSEIDKIARMEYNTFPAQLISVPLVRGARAWFECRVQSSTSVGDHTAFFGKVLRAEADESKKPLVLFNRVYYALGDERGSYP